MPKTLVLLRELMSNGKVCDGLTKIEQNKVKKKKEKIRIPEKVKAGPDFKDLGDMLAGSRDALPEQFKLHGL